MADVPTKNDDRHKEEVASGRDESEGTLEISGTTHMKNVEDDSRVENSETRLEGDKVSKEKVGVAQGMASRTRSSTASESDDLSERYLYKIAKEIEPELYFDLGMTLGFKYAEVQAVKTSNPHDSRQWVFLILNKWRQGQRRDADKIRILIEALEEIEKVDLANKVRAEKQQSLAVATTASTPLITRCDEVMITQNNTVTPIALNIPEPGLYGMRLELTKTDKGVAYEVSRLSSATTTDSQEINFEIVALKITNDPTFKQKLVDFLLQNGVDLQLITQNSIVMKVKVVDQQKAAKLIKDFHTGSLTMTLVELLIPEDTRKKYIGTSFTVKLTLDEGFVRDCLGIKNEDDVVSLGEDINLEGPLRKKLRTETTVNVEGDEQGLVAASDDYSESESDMNIQPGPSTSPAEDPPEKEKEMMALYDKEKQFAGDEYLSPLKQTLQGSHESAGVTTSVYDVRPGGSTIQVHTKQYEKKLTDPWTEDRNKHSDEYLAAQPDTSDEEDDIAAVELEGDELNCPICMKRLKEPKLTPCGHTMCCRCLDNWALEKGRERCPCPVCKQQIDMPGGGARDLKGNYIVLGFLETLKDKSRKTPGKVKKTRKLIKYCKSHPDEPLKFYCIRCSEIVCRDCIVTIHEGHKPVGLKQGLIHTSEQRELTLQTIITNNNRFQEHLDNKAAKVKEKVQSAKQVQTNAVNTQYEYELKEVTSTYDIETTKSNQIESITKQHDENIVTVDNIQEDNIRTIKAHYDQLQSEITLTQGILQQLNSDQEFDNPDDSIRFLQELAEKVQEWKRSPIADIRPELAIPQYVDGDSTGAGITFGKILSTRNIVLKQVKIEKLCKTTPEIKSITVLENQSIVTAHEEAGINIHDPTTYVIKHHIDMECIRLTSIGNQIICVDYKSHTISILSDEGERIGSVDYVELPVQCVAAAQGGALAVIHYGSETHDKLSFINIEENRIISTCDVKNDGNVPWMTITCNNEAIISYCKDNIVRCYNSHGEELFTYDPNTQGGHKLEAKGVCSDVFGNVIVASSTTNTVHLLGSTLNCRQLLITEGEDIKWPEDVAIDSEGNLIVGCVLPGEIYRVKYLE